MLKQNKRLLGQLLILFIVNIVLILALSRAAPAEAAVYRQGSSGEQVRTIQTKLKRWGYYAGEIDGIYCSRTTAAVRWFQQVNGLAADGVCGPQTLAALGMSATGSTAGTTGNRDNDLYLLARMIAAEARGEVYNGQVAVGAVILNRVAHPSFPNSIAGVIYQAGAFSSIGDGQFDRVSITDSARRAAQDALNGSDPTGGAVYFYNPAKTTSKWIWSRPVVATIGNHVFAK